MVKAPPDNLGLRQWAINARVNEAVENNVHFDTIRKESEATEVDKLYKIDVAAKYKNVDYILETFKSGNSLFTSRALKKCQWLYEDEYSHLINPTYLRTNVFPFTSMKMKRKIIKTAAAHITKPERAAVFFHYCMKEKMKSTAFTCLLYCTEDFKLDQLRNNKEPSFKSLQDKDIIYFRFLVGKSFVILDALLSFISIHWKISETTRQFKNLFSVSEEKYLDIAEKYISTYYGFDTDKFDPKLSDSIMKRHKHRVLAKPRFYVNTVNVDVLVRNSTIEDAKIYTDALLPDSVDEFWDQNIYDRYRSLFRIIPHDDTYAFFKKIYAERYPKGVVFEMHPEFYFQQYCQFMTLKEIEDWSFSQLTSGKQLFGVGRNYLFYRYINFETAFEEIKKLINVTTDADVRNDMVNALIESAKGNNRERETLFRYYNKRHMNEAIRYRESFIDKVLIYHNVFEFDEDCWTSFYTLLLNIEVAYLSDHYMNQETVNNDKNYKTVALLYHIIHRKDMPERLLTFLHEHFEIHLINQHLEKIYIEEEKQMLHEYFFNFYMKILVESKTETYEYDEFNLGVERKLRRCFDNVAASIKTFNKNGDIIEKDPNPKKKKRYICPNDFSVGSLLRDLKKDKKVCMINLSRTRNNFEHRSGLKINNFLKKVRIYFPDDLREIYLDMFQSLILNDKLNNSDPNRHYGRNAANVVRTSINAIFQVADEEVKVDMMEKYFQVKTNPEDGQKIDVHSLRVRKAICRYACLSSPPMPLASMVVYMKAADTAKACMHAFDTYTALVPLPTCQQLVNSLIDAPVSIQKHAIRLAFQCFEYDRLKDTILDIWQNTKNVTLRSVIYKAFYKKVADTEQKEFYDILKTFTLDLNKHDEADVFDITVSKTNKLPEEFLGDYIESVWKAVQNFEDIEPNITRKLNVVIYMKEHIHLLKEEFATTMVYDHLNTMLLENKLNLAYSKEDIAVLFKEKWVLTAQYSIFFAFNNPPKKYIQLAQWIFRKSIENWNGFDFDVHIYQQSCWDYFNNLKNICLKEVFGKFENAIPIFEGILEIVDNDMHFCDSYLMMWELQLIIVTANVIKRNRELCREKQNVLDVIAPLVKEFGEEVVKLVSGYVEFNQYFVSFSLTIKDKIRENVEDLLKLILEERDEEHRDWKWKSYMDDVLISLAETLAKTEQVEIYLLAIQLLPSDCEQFSSDKFKRLLNKFHEFSNDEVQLSLYQKFQRYYDRKQSASRSVLRSILFSSNEST